LEWSDDNIKYEDIGSYNAISAVAAAYSCYFDSDTSRNFVLALYAMDISHSIQSIVRHSIRRIRLARKCRVEYIDTINSMTLMNTDYPFPNYLQEVFNYICPSGHTCISWNPINRALIVAESDAVEMWYLSRLFKKVIFY